MRYLYLFCLCLCLSLSSIFPLSATDYYVRLDGNDKNSGLKNSAKESWATMEYAVKQLAPGDHLFVVDGKYNTKGVFIKDLHGTESKPIVISSLNQYGAKLTRDKEADPDRSVVELSNSSYITFEGFEIYDLYGMESGVDVRDVSHHITIRDCYVHDCACGGISSRNSDYLILESNVVRGNAKRNKWNCSGISVLQAAVLDQDSGFHIIIRKNIAFENECTLPFSPRGYTTPTDGNGIIIDYFRNTKESGYKAQVLVENNLTFNNGGKGINIFKSDNVTIRNNTSYHNLRVLSKYDNSMGEITLYESKGSKVYNNIVIQNPNIEATALRFYDNVESTLVYNNLLVGEMNVEGQNFELSNNKIADASRQDFAGLRGPSIDVSTLERKAFREFFGLKKDSPAIDKGWNKKSASEDADGINRPQGNGADIGCYEFN